MTLDFGYATFQDKCIMKVPSTRLTWQFSLFLVTNIIFQGPIFTTRFSPSGRWLLTASLDGSSCLWDVPGKRLHRQYHGHDGRAFQSIRVAWSWMYWFLDCCLDVDWINDNMFASCGADRLVHIYSVDEEKSIKTFEYVSSEYYIRELSLTSM